MVLGFELENLTKTYVGRHDVKLNTEWKKQIPNLSNTETDS
jgi:hypothetical protein